MKLFARFFLTVLFLFTSSLSSLETNSDLKLTSLVEKYCALPIQEGKFKAIKSILQKLSPKMAEEGEKVLGYILPQACFRNYPDWLMDRTINLSVYAFHDGRLKLETLKYMNELIPSMSVGKEDFISYGIILENLLSVGIEKEYIFDIFNTALNESYNPASAEALIYFYIIDASENKNHRQALNYALGESKLYKSQDRMYMLNHLFNPEEEKSKIIKGANQEKIKAQLEEKLKDFWKKYKGKIKIQETFAKLEQKIKKEEMVEQLTVKIGVPYGYRMNKDFGVDVNGMITIITKSGVDDLPYKYNSYCSVESVNSASSLKTGDILLFSSEPGGREATAMGIYLNDAEFLYVTISNGITRASLGDLYYKNSFIKGCRIIK
jgi:hypothetical protein